MSSLKTDKLGLNKWVPTDYVSMSEFNDNFQKIDDAHKDVTTQLADTEKIYNILNYGGNGNGTFSNNTAYDLAKIKGRVHFPQNQTNDAIYYFETNPIFAGIKITADKGVKLSLPNNWMKFSDADIDSNIIFISRDRIGTETTIYKRTGATYPAIVGGELNTDLGISKIENIGTNDVNVYRFSNGNILDNSQTSVTNDLYSVLPEFQDNIQKHLYPSIKAIIGYKYDALYLFNGTDKSIVSFAGITVFDDNNNLKKISITSGDNYAIGTYLSGGTYTESLVTNKIFKATNDNKFRIKDTLSVGARLIKQNVVEFYINDILIDTVQLEFNANKIGFLLSGGSGNSTQVGQITKSYIDRSGVNAPLNIAYFGDSITAGDGSLSHTALIKDMLLGRYGISDVQYTNYAVGGQRSDQQLTIMQNTDLSQFNVVVITVGTNDSLQDKTVDSYISNVTAMVTLARNANCKVILALPPFATNYSDTNGGYTFENSERTAKFRHAVKRIVATFATHHVVLAETTSEQGLVSKLNWSNTLQDNVHMKMLGELMLGKGIARAIVKSFSRSLDIESKISESTVTFIPTTIVTDGGTLKCKYNSTAFSIQGYLTFTTALTANSTSLCSLPNIFKGWNNTDYTTVCMAVDSTGKYGYVPIYINKNNNTLCIHAGANVRGSLNDVKQISIALTMML